MVRVLAARLVQAAITLALLATASYLLIGLMPGDPIAVAIASDPKLGPADAAALRALFDLDRPLIDRFGTWALRALGGEFGHSRLFARPVTEVLWPALGATLLLAVPSFLLSATLGVLLGALSAARPRGPLDRLVTLTAFASAALPAFWLGLLLIIVFAVEAGVLPAGGPPDGDGLAALVRHLVLPIATVTAAGFATYARQTRAAVLATFAEPYVRTARAKGAHSARILWGHALPNAAVPILTVTALDLATLMSGVLTVEIVFAWPGMGKLLYDAVMGNDYNLALFALLAAATTTLAASLTADLMQRVLDPRLP